MAAVVIVEGQIRTSRILRRKSDGSVYGHEVAVLTQAGSHLGETLKITVFGEDNPGKPGDDVAWAVSLSAGKYGLDARYQGPLIEVPVFAAAA